MITSHQWQDIIARSIVTASALHNILPPWDWDAAFLSDFPGVRKAVLRIVHNRWYKMSVYAVGYVALNARSTLWQSISMPSQISRMQNPGA
jgi:hypothetical protein